MTATKGDLEDLLQDRPKKFSPDEVNFHKAAKDEPICSGCQHWFYGPVLDHGVCQVMRPDTEEEHVAANWTCQFHTVDGVHFPLLKKGGDAQ